MKRLSESLRAAVMLAAMSVGCGGVFADLDDPAYPEQGKKLAACRLEMRAFVQTAADPRSKETANAAYALYESCKKRLGVQ